MQCLKIVKKNLNKGGKSGALIVDLSKVFDFPQHDLLLGNWAYYKSLQLISSFLSNRKYRRKISWSSSEWGHLLIGVPQGSVLGPSLFSIYMCDLFSVYGWNVANYTDDTALYACEKK